jgi:hypothetical protein
MKILITELFWQAGIPQPASYKPEYVPGRKQTMLSLVCEVLSGQKKTLPGAGQTAMTFI